MEGQNPFSEALFWKWMIGATLIAIGVLALAGTKAAGGEIFNAADLIPAGAGVISILFGLGLIFSEDPAKL